jgi:predicted DNA binding CopG/RHH family protein
MSRKTIHYTDEPIDAKIMNDFLPPPEELIFKEENIKVTLTLTKKTIDFFKDQAASHHTGYQTMIRALLDQYADHYSGN